MPKTPVRSQRQTQEVETSISVAPSTLGHLEEEIDPLKLQEIIIAPLLHKFGLPQTLTTNMMGKEASGASSKVIAKSWLTVTITG